tara:strand:- start:1146 stop:1505 length:360 start_codon:yes stop_codon:yes gene_type:complete
MTDAAEVLAQKPEDGIDLSVVLMDTDDTPFVDSNKKERQVGDYFKECLSINIPGDEKIEGKVKLDRYDLYLEVRDAMKDGKRLVLESSQKTMIQELLAKIYAPIIYGQIYRIMEGPRKG